MGFVGDLRSDEDSFHVIAEVGNNHQGDVEKCMRLFEAAVAAGAETWALRASSVRRALRRGRFHLRNVLTYPSRRNWASEGSQTANPGHESATSLATEESTPGKPPSTDPRQQASGQ